MTLMKQGFETATLASVSTSNPSGDSPFNAVSSPAPTVDATHAAAGSNAIKFAPTSGSAITARWTGMGSSAFAVSFYVWIDTIPTVETWLCNITTSGGSRVLMLEISNSGKFRVIDTTGTSTPVWTYGTANFPTGQWVRVEAYATVAAGSATVDAAYYLGDSTTAVASNVVTTANTGTTAADIVIFGKADTGTYASAFWMDSLQFQTAASAKIGAWATSLGTPSVTLGTTTNPSTSGGTDGSQVVTWGAITNATSYDAYKANKASPAQSDFTLVASGVTSPYTFTGLAAGTYSFGIMAKP